MPLPTQPVDHARADIAFVVWDAVESRTDPAASFELKLEVFTFPDLAVCVSQYEGCLTYPPSDCFVNAEFTMFGQYVRPSSQMPLQMFIYAVADVQEIEEGREVKVGDKGIDYVFGERGGPGLRKDNRGMAKTTSSGVNLSRCSLTLVSTTHQGFMEAELEADEASLAIQEAYPHCRVLPTSKLTVNQTGIDNGDINHFYATFGVGGDGRDNASCALLWDEDPHDDFDPAVELASRGVSINTQFVNLFFVDVDLGVEAIGEELTDAKLPYNRLSPTTNGSMVGTMSHMVIEMTQFQPISTSSGEKQDPQRTFTQSSTSATVNWYNPDFNEELAALLFNMFIPKFEYTSIEQVDPVDGWAIIGAIGGVWQFVVIAFGLFFVFSEKQLPDKKIRNFKKSVAKPASMVKRHLSSASSRDPTIPDVEIDTSNEDLPIGWVKRQRKNGTTYYYNPLTGDARENSPTEAHAVVAVGVTPAPERRSIARAFRAAHNPGTSTSSSANRTRSPHPTGCAGGGVQVIDAPMHRSAKSPFDLSRNSNINISINSNSGSCSGGGSGSGGIAAPSDSGSASPAPPSHHSPPEGPEAAAPMPELP
ncbi:unnamed protein product [Ectocarpus sp. CCAP 1310/34]|nr:unnamed protein product [Ectocarpus sp. CCAP 1310/34]